MAETFDVIVIGAGGSGLAAAYSASEHGGRVLVLEKRPQPGGTTGIAVGSFTAAGTSIQRQAGIDDSPELHIEDAGKFPPPAIEARNADAMRAFFLQEAANTFEWLRGLGLSFVGPSPEPPNRNPRMHNVVPGAKAYIAALQLGLQRRGAVLLTNASAESLIKDGDRVVGVRAIVRGETHEYHASRGVILAAGDYASNHDLIAEHRGEQFRCIEGINPFATGDGHKLAKDAGAWLVNMDVTYGPELRFVPSSQRPFQQCFPASGAAARVMGAIAPRLPKWVMRSMIKRLLVTWQHPENSLFDDGAILVNREGQCFVDETKYPDREIALSAQPEKIAFILLDRRLGERYSAWPHFISTAPDIAYAYVADYLRLRPDIARSGDSLASVASQAGIDVAALENSVKSYNASLGQTSESKQPLESAPWVLLGPVKAYFTTTEGGAVVNQRMQVLGHNGNILRGLYAVGQNGLSGMILWSHGLHIAWAMTSGRLAGIAVMSESARPESVDLRAN